MRGFLRVVAVTPPMKVADVDYNIEKIVEFAEKAAKRDARIIVFPELCVTGYTAADLFHQRHLLDKAKLAAGEIAKRTSKLNSAILIGLPLAVEGKIFNVAAVIYNGSIQGFVPKSYPPNYKEFYEGRWFAMARDLTVSEVGGVPIGTDLLFNLGDAVLGVEICEDLWTAIPPSSYQVLRGATVIANLSASNDLVGKADYRRELVTQQSGRGICGYIYASCGVHESTTDVVFGGHSMIAENGSILAESQRFQRDGEMIISDIDLERLAVDRERTSSFGQSGQQADGKKYRTIELQEFPSAFVAYLERRVDAHPFVPGNKSERDKRCNEIFSIQTAGLAKRLEHTAKSERSKKMLIGVSGGLDSTLALLVAAKTADLLGWPRKSIYAFTMPGFATTNRTKSNAVKLSEVLGVNLETIDITEGAKQHLKDLGHNGETQDLTFENTQARYRTMVLFNKGNQLGGIVIGTGDLSEIALGWCTYNGDHIAHYNVNCSVPKTLVKYLVEWVSEQKEFSSAKEVLIDILATPISPELVRAKDGEIEQKTEDIVGPYELHDFFLYHFIRWGSAPKKILWLAEKAFAEKYDAATIKKWLKLFIERFFGAQWKRSVATDGPKVGSISLSPRGDWRMPSDASVALWLKELE